MHLPATTADRLGVVVIGRNEGDRLYQCINSILAGLGTEAASRIIYVDSGSTDGSPEAVERLGVQVVRLDPTLPFTAARGRNEGFATMRALHSVDLVQLVDGDCEMSFGWWAVALAFADGHPDVAMICGRLRERHPDASIYNGLCQMEWDAPESGETDQCGGIALVRAEAFEADGGFRADLVGGEEPELCVRLRAKGWRIWRLGTEMAVHDAAMSSFGQWWGRAVRNGAGFAEVHFMHRRSPGAVWGRETARAFAWGGVLPAAIVLGSLVHPAALALALAYPAQVWRIARRNGIRKLSSWQNAFLLTLGKFAEFQGMVRFATRLGRVTSPARPSRSAARLTGGH